MPACGRGRSAGGSRPCSMLRAQTHTLPWRAVLGRLLTRPQARHAAAPPRPAPHTFLATTHCDGTPSMLSLACLTSLYSCWLRAGREVGRVGGGEAAGRSAGSGWRRKRWWLPPAGHQRASLPTHPPTDPLSAASRPSPGVGQHHQDELAGAVEGLARRLCGARGGARGRWAKQGTGRAQDPAAGSRQRAAGSCRGSATGTSIPAQPARSAPAARRMTSAGLAPRGAMTAGG